MDTIKDLQPKAIWENFYKLTQVPRPSNHEEKAREFMMNWAKEHHIDARMDEAGNIIMTKPATPGMENRKGIILQGHLDMVPQKMKIPGMILPKTRSTHISTENGYVPKEQLWVPTTEWALLRQWQY